MNQFRNKIAAIDEPFRRHFLKTSYFGLSPLGALPSECDRFFEALGVPDLAPVEVAHGPQTKKKETDRLSAFAATRTHHYVLA